ncbi:hypothetical protein ACRN9A_19450 [Shewanella frigidimarina]|uniref:hypothetical protein n=1 Tax=Shewanella frigidimarina TaxID=56812 RepID=UPI003D7A6F01
MSNTFVDILSSANKKELTKNCKHIEVQRNDFTDFIHLCKSGLCHLEHRIKYFDIVPDDVKERSHDWDNLNALSNEISSIERQKSLSRLFKMHGFRKYIVGHLFLERNCSVNPEWHFIFFEINELKDANNHWKEGAHIHLSNYLFSNLNVADVWNNFVKTHATPTQKIHVRYNDPTRK